MAETVSIAGVSYRTGDLLGEGSFGTVLEAIPLDGPGTGQQLAVKRFRRHDRLDPSIDIRNEKKVSEKYYTHPPLK